MSHHAELHGKAPGWVIETKSKGRRLYHGFREKGDRAMRANRPVELVSLNISVDEVFIS
jgi:hypothetical protein